MARGAFAANMVRAWRADWELFGVFCLKHELTVLPASAKTVRRYVATIGRAHRAAGVADPCSSEEVKLALKEMSRQVPARQRQARGLVWKEIEEFLEFRPRNLRDVGDRC